MYMPQEEREAWREKDPIERLGRQLRAWGYLTEEEDEAMGEAIEEELEEGVAFAKASPKPPVKEALTHVYGEFDYQGKR